MFSETLVLLAGTISSAVQRSRCEVCWAKSKRLIFKASCTGGYAGGISLPSKITVPASFRGRNTKSRMLYWLYAKRASSRQGRPKAAMMIIVSYRGLEMYVINLHCQKPREGDGIDGVRLWPGWRGGTPARRSNMLGATAHTGAQRTAEPQYDRRSLGGETTLQPTWKPA